MHIDFYSGSESAGEDITAGLACHVTGGEIMILDAATSPSIGVSVNAMDDTEKGDVQSEGVCNITLAAAITVSGSGVELTTAAGGLYTSTIADGEYVQAISVAAGSAAAGKCRVKLVPVPYAKSVPA